MACGGGVAKLTTRRQLFPLSSDPSQDRCGAVIATALDRYMHRHPETGHTITFEERLWPNEQRTSRELPT